MSGCTSLRVSADMTVSLRMQTSKHTARELTSACAASGCCDIASMPTTISTWPCSSTGSGFDVVGAGNGQDEVDLLHADLALAPGLWRKSFLLPPSGRANGYDGTEGIC